LDVIITILKYTGAVIAGTYGVYATLTDFKEERDGRKVLSRKGYIGLALLVFSAILTLSSDAFKDYREHVQAKIDEQKREQLLADQKKIGTAMTDQLNQSSKISLDLGIALDRLKQSSTKMDTNLRTTSQVLHETTRLLDPLDKLTFTLKLTIPSQQDSVRPYFARLSSVIDNTQEARDFPFRGFTASSKTFPDIRRSEEREIAILATALYVTVGFSRVRDAGTFANDPGVIFLFKANCNAEGAVTQNTDATTTRKTTLIYYPRPRRNLELRCETSELKFEVDDTTIRSLQDLHNLQTAVWINQDYLVPPVGESAHHFEPMIDFRVSSIELRVASGRTLLVTDFRKFRCHRYGDNEHCYIARIEYEPSF
jgi:hypothetical protein